MLARHCRALWDAKHCLVGHGRWTTRRRDRAGHQDRPARAGDRLGRPQRAARLPARPPSLARRASLRSPRRGGGFVRPQPRARRAGSARLLAREARAGGLRPRSRRPPGNTTTWVVPIFARVRSQAAAEEFRRTLERRPQDFWPNFYQGLCAYRLGQLRRRLRCLPDVYRAGARRPPNAITTAPWPMRPLAGPICALADYNRALELDRSLTAAALNRGLLRYKAGRHDEAIADFRHALAASKPRGCRPDPLQPGTRIPGRRRPIVGTDQWREGPRPRVRRGSRTLRSPPTRVVISAPCDR